MNNFLFVIDSLHCGGAEKSLVSLLNSIDYSKYKVDLLLFKSVNENPTDKYIYTTEEFASLLEETDNQTCVRLYQK